MFACFASWRWEKTWINGLRQRMPGLADGMASLLATLERTGCISLDNANPEGYYEHRPSS